MELRLLPITAENRAEVCRLAVTPAQRGQIETVSDCLSEADICPFWRAVGIYDGNRPVGFAMYGYWPTEGRLWFDRFLIDGRAQGRGYGKQALPLLLRRLEAEYRTDTIYLSVTDPEIPAVGLYRQNGFVFTGELDPAGEHIMVRQTVRENFT